jgi:iron complex transport system substrate-binding protein
VAVVLLVACGTDEPVVDASPDGRVAKEAAMRVVAIGPAVADVVHALSPEALVAVDDASAEREELSSLPRVGFSRRIAAEGILSVGPTHVILTEHAGPPETIEQLRSAGIEVVQLPHERSVDGVRALTTGVAEALEHDASALLERFEASCARIAPATGKRALFVYARGTDTMSVSGTGTAGAAMLGLAGLVNAFPDVEGYKPLTPEGVVEADPDVLVFTTRGLEAVGGVAGLAKVPGLALTRAVRDGHVAAVEDLQLLAFGLETCDGARALADQVR